MTTLITADLHLAEGVRDRYRIDFQKHLRSEVKRRNVECVVILGDLTEAKDRHASWLVNQVVDAIHALAQECKVLIVQGNHDYKDEEFAFFHFVDKLENVRWVSHVTPLDAPHSYPSELGRMLILPHTNNYKRDWKGLDFASFDTILCHQTFEGSDTGFGRVLRGVPLDVFPEDAFVLSGDIHKPQQLGPVTYVGAPYTVDFGDEYKPRVIVIDGDKVKSVPCPGPQKRVLDIHKTSDLERAEISSGDIVRVRVHLATRDGDEWVKQYERIKNWAKGASVNLHNVQPVTVDPGKGKRVRVNDAAPEKRKSDTALIQEYGERRGASKNQIKRAISLLNGYTDTGKRLDK